MNTRRPPLALALCATLALTGCVDNSYDLDNVDETLRIGAGTTLWLPASSTDSIRLVDLIKLRDDDIVKILWDEQEKDSIFCVQADGDDQMHALVYAGGTEMTIQNLIQSPMQMIERPKFLDGDSVILDLANPCLMVECDNESPLAVKADVMFYSWREGQRIDSVAPAAVAVPANSVARYYFSPQADSHLPTRYQNHAWRAMDVNRLLCIHIKRNGVDVPVAPDSITSSVRHLTLDAPSTLPLASGNFTLKYSIYAPFRFGPRLRFTYEDTSSGWYSDLGNMEHTDFLGLVSSLEVENNFPVQCTLQATPVDESGQEIEGITISSALAEPNATTPVSLQLRAADGGTLARYFDPNVNDPSGGKSPKLDGLRLRLLFSTNGVASTRPLHHDACVRLRNVKVGLQGGIRYDAN